MQFLESVCEEEVNRKKQEKGEIDSKYWCYQLHKQKTIYRDINNLPVEVVVKHKAGCELRCIEKDCKRGKKKGVNLLKMIN